MLLLGLRPHPSLPLGALRLCSPCCAQALGGVPGHPRDACVAPPSGVLLGAVRLVPRVALGIIVGRALRCPNIAGCLCRRCVVVRVEVCGVVAFERKLLHGCSNGFEAALG